MKSRVKKRRLYARLQWAVLLPRQFVKDTLRGVAEANAGKVTPYLWEDDCGDQGGAHRHHRRGHAGRQSGLFGPVDQRREKST